MPTPMDLREKRANIWSQLQEVLDRTDNDPSGDDLQTYNRMDTELDRLDDQIGKLEKNEKRGANYNRVDRSGVVADDDSGESDEEQDAKYGEAFNSFLRFGMNELEGDEKRLMAGMRPDPKRNGPRNAAGVGTSAGGGYLVPPLFRSTVIEAQKWFGPMLEEAEIITTETGAILPWPTNDDTANVGAILAENTQVTEQDVVLGTAQIAAYMYTSKLVRVSFQLLQDRKDFDTWLARKLGERLGRILNQHFTTGTGSSQPLGIVTGGTVGITGTGSFGTAGAFGTTGGDNLISLVESLDPAYGSSRNLKFMGHQQMRKAARLLKDTQGRYMWEISLQNGVPDSLLGYPFVLNNDMAVPAASSKSLLFGDIRESYLGRIVQDLSTMRLTERYADYLQVGFLAFERADGTVQNASAYRVFQTSVTV